MSLEDRISTCVYCGKEFTGKVRRGSCYRCYYKHFQSRKAKELRATSDNKCRMCGINGADPALEGYCPSCYQRVLVILSTTDNVGLVHLAKAKRAKFAIPKWRNSKDREIAILAFRANGPSVVTCKSVHLKYDEYLTSWEPKIVDGVSYYELVGDVVKVGGLEALLG